MKIKVWNGRANRTVNGWVIKHPDGFRLFRSGRKWWLYYGSGKITGSFKSKKEAVGWFKRGGR
jgi:hypothetical protein